MVQYWVKFYKVFEKKVFIYFFREIESLQHLALKTYPNCTRNIESVILS